MAKVAWTAEAHLWLRDIHDYIAAENPAATDRVSLTERIHVNGLTVAQAG